jgi:hypothetical protein
MAMRFLKSGLAGGGGGTSLVTKSAVSLGTQAAVQTAYTYYAVTGAAARGLVSLLRVTADAAGLFDIVVRGAGSDLGVLYLQADGITGDYEITAPWLYQAASGDSLHVGIRNRHSASRTFTLASLRLEKFA